MYLFKAVSIQPAKIYKIKEKYAQGLVIKIKDRKDKEEWEKLKEAMDQMATTLLVMREK